MDEINRKIKEKFNGPDFIEFLSEELSLSELNSLLLSVFNKRASALKPADIFEAYLSNRFSRPSGINPRRFNAFDRLCYSLLPEGFDTIELSPLAPFGSCSGLAPVHQNNIVSTLRNSEVMGDPTNIMAIECAARRKDFLRKQPKSTREIKLACSQRVVRAQMFEHKDHSASFRIFSLCSAGRDEGNLKFELRNLREQIQFYLILIEELGKFSAIKNCRLRLFELNDQDNSPILDEIRHMITHFSKARLSIEKPDKISQSYYEHLRFMIDIENSEGVTMNFVDGGFTNWTMQLLGNRKERLLTSGIGSELVLKVLNPSLPD